MVYGTGIDNVEKITSTILEISTTSYTDIILHIVYISLSADIYNLVLDLHNLNIVLMII